MSEKSEGPYQEPRSGYQAGTVKLSPFERIKTSRSVSEQVEVLAAEFVSQVEPLRLALQAIIDTSLDDRPAWEAAVLRAVEELNRVGLSGRPAELKDNERWTVLMDRWDTGRAFAGYALCDLLASLVAESPDAFSLFYSRLDQHKNARQGTLIEFHDVLGFLFVEHMDRVSGPFVPKWLSIWPDFPSAPYHIPARLAEAGFALSPRASQCVHDWVERDLTIGRCYSLRIWPHGTRPSWHLGGENMAGVEVVAEMKRAETTIQPDDTPNQPKVGKEQDSKTIETKPTKEPRFTKPMQVILIEMLALNAVSPSKKVKRDKVVQKFNKSRTGADYARQFGDLKELKFTDSDAGPDGGVWLTALGKSKAAELQK